MDWISLLNKKIYYCEKEMATGLNRKTMLQLGPQYTPKISACMNVYISMEGGATY